MTALTKGQPAVLLVFLNGMKFSKDGDFELRDRYLRFCFQVKQRDKLSFVAIGAEPWEFEVEVPYNYPPNTWFDPSNFHDPETKKLEPPEPKRTQNRNLGV